MLGIPRVALSLGLAGTIPFIFGALVALGVLSTPIGERFAEQNWYLSMTPTGGKVLLVKYGVIILSFMSGVLWGFAARNGPPERSLAYALSVIPALYAFFWVPLSFSQDRPVESALFTLTIGFAGILVLDWFFQRWALAPDWWMWLRLLITVIVLACLIGAARA